jgi:hypothetical protein
MIVIKQSIVNSTTRSAVTINKTSLTLSTKPSNSRFPLTTHIRPRSRSCKMLNRCMSSLPLTIKNPPMPQPHIHCSPILCFIVHLLPSSPHRHRKHEHKHKLKPKRTMNPEQQQFPQPHPQGQGLTDDQQAQWQQQQQFQQQQHPMQGLQHPQPQHYAPFPPEGSPVPMRIPDQSTPQLDAMYSQGAQGHEQLYGQQTPIQNPQQFFGQQQMPQTPQEFAQPPQQQMPQTPQPFGQQPQQQAQYGMPMDQAGQYYQPQPPQPDPQGFAYVGQQGTPLPQAAFNPATQSWEQANVTEANPFANINQTTKPSPRQTQALRDAEKFNARQRIEALELEHERQEVQTALAISAMIAPGAAELEEQFQDQLHQAEMESLETWERDVRRHVEGGYADVGQFGGFHMGAESQQAQFGPGVSRAASVVDAASVRSPGPSEFSYAPSADGGYQHHG